MSIRRNGYVRVPVAGALLRALLEIDLMKTDDGGSGVLSYFEARRAEMLEFTRGLVEQESMSREADATRQIAEKLGESLASTGAAVELLNDPHYGSTLRARFNPRNDESQNDGQLLVVGHLDTVWPIGTLAGRPFRVEGDRAFGPGIFDMKAGVMLATFAMRAIKELGRATKRRTTLLMTCDEETGSHFSRDIIEEEGGRARAHVRRRFRCRPRQPLIFSASP